jgi:nucleotide-binding universal stress UspA family protein
MASIATAKQVTLNNVLYLTDFSQPAEAALPFVTAIAHKYGAKVYAAHVMLPDVYACMAPEFSDVVTEGMERAVEAKMQRVGSRLNGLRHETLVEWGPKIWPVLQRMIQRNNVDLVVIGTHGRTGVVKFLLGSVTEEVFRCSNVPVLTIGPAVSSKESDEGFKCVLFATDFTWESLARSTMQFQWRERTMRASFSSTLSSNSGKKRSWGTCLRLRPSTT